MRLSIIIGFIVGLIGTLVAAYAAPFLEFDRIRSDTEVLTNGGRQERFVIRDGDAMARLPSATQSEQAVYPQGARWYPELAPFAGGATVYRLRNASGVVIGTASRVRGVETDSDVEWMLHIPARGTMALTGASDDTAGVGSLTAGDGEFSGLQGEWETTREDNGWALVTRVVVPRPDDVPVDEVYAEEEST